MDTIKLLCLITALTGPLITISYHGIAEKRGWQVGKAFISERPGWFFIVSFLIMIAACIFAFKIFVWWQALLIILGTWFAASILTLIFKSYSQHLATFLTSAGVCLFMVAYSSKATDISKQETKANLQNNATDTSAATNTIVEGTSPIDTVIVLTDMNITNDKNFVGTFTFTIKNISTQTITNILLRKGHCNNKSPLDRDNKKDETINYEVNLKTGDTKTFSFKANSNDLSFQMLTDAYGIIKVRFENGTVTTDHCHEIHKSK
jgi:hypothetical protein